MRTPEELEAEILASFKEEAEKWIGRSIHPTVAAGKLVFWVAMLKALGAEQSIEMLVDVGMQTMATTAVESEWKM